MKKKSSSIKINIINENIYYFELIIDINSRLKIIAFINKENYNKIKTQIILIIRNLILNKKRAYNDIQK